MQKRTLWLVMHLIVIFAGCQVFNDSCPVTEPKVWGYLGAPLDIRREFVRQCEAPVGNLIADAILGYDYGESIPPRVALLNAGAIRDEVSCGEAGEKRKFISPGAVTDQDIYQLLPFRNSITLVDITGDELKNVLEWGVSALNQEGELGAKGFFLQVAGEVVDGQGIEVTVDCSREPQALSNDRKSIVFGGERITSVSISGQPLLPQGTYRVAVLDYMLGTGDQGVPNDGFVSLYQAVFVDTPTVPIATNIPLTDVVREMLKAGLEENYPAVQGRIVRQNCNANCGD